MVLSIQVVITSLPRNSDSIPILKIFYLVTMGECTVCFLASCLAIRLLSMKVKEFPPLPSWAKWLIYRTKCEEMMPILQKLRMAACCSCGDNGVHPASSEEIALHETKSEDSNESTQSLVSRRNDSAELPPYHHNGDSQCCKNYNGTRRCDENGSNDSIEVGENTIENSIRRKKTMSQRENEMVAWKFLVEYVDRLCPYVFFILFLMSSLAILVPAAYDSRDDD